MRFVFGEAPGLADGCLLAGSSLVIVLCLYPCSASSSEKGISPDALGFYPLTSFNINCFLKDRVSKYRDAGSEDFSVCILKRRHHLVHCLLPANTLL